MHQGCLGHLQLVLRRLQTELCRLHRPLPRLQAQLGAVETFTRHDLVFRQAQDAGQLRLGELQLRLGALQLGACLATGGPRRAHPGLALGAAAGVEQRGRGRLEGRQNRLLGRHGIARLQLDAQHATRQRRRHLVALAHAGLALFVEGDLQVATPDFCEVRGDRLGLECPDEDRDQPQRGQHQKERPPSGALPGPIAVVRVRKVV